MIQGRSCHRLASSKGINRVAPGGLYRIAQALGVELSYFFEGLETESRFEPSPQQCLLLDLTRNYVNIPARKHQEAIVALARALGQGETGDEPAA